MVCTPTIPQGSNVLEPQFSFDVRTFLNPITNYNRTQLRTVNILNNVLLGRHNLNKYPSLKARADIGPVTDQEFAEFLLNSGLSLDFVQDVFINDFPVPVDYSLIEEIVVQVTGERDLSTSIIGTKNPRNLDRLLEAEDLYYSTSLLSQNSNICEALTNPFRNIISVLGTARDLAEGVKDLAGDINKVITDTRYNSLSGIINDLTRRVFSFQQQITAFIDDFAKSMIQQVKSIEDTISRIFSTAASIPTGTYKFMRKRVADTKKLYSVEEIKNLKENVNTIFVNGMKQFEDTLPDVLNFLLLVSCGLFSGIQDFMKAPVDNLNNFVVSYKNSVDIIGGYSIEQRNLIKGTGAVRVTPDQRAKDIQGGKAAYARANPGNIIPSDITPQEASLLDKINENGLVGYFTYVEGRNIRNMGKVSTERYEANKTNTLFQQLYNPDENFHYDLGVDGGVVDAGWAKVNMSVWVKLIRVIDTLKAQNLLNGDVILNSAYRSPFYNSIIISGARNSKHSSGEALDVSFTNFSTRTGEEFIRQASINGFGGISFYPSSDFTHIDIGPVRTWGENGIYTSVINKHRYG